ncbi:hypothetical protein EVAR_64617_1 [Eumeta japonica]|uniref:Uncharacterized protein n=1 Tax=Eumeta variegata TaxID=151549 RepID=A0A4C1ZD85_EUMVA|nr:hypothetical protein EVAR_64617_1 [Eumeta japonica]
MFLDYIDKDHGQGHRRRSRPIRNASVSRYETIENCPDRFHCNRCTQRGHNTDINWSRLRFVAFERDTSPWSWMRSDQLANNEERKQGIWD